MSQKTGRLADVLYRPPDGRTVRADSPRVCAAHCMRAAVEPSPLIAWRMIASRRCASVQSGFSTVRERSRRRSSSASGKSRHSAKLSDRHFAQLTGNLDPESELDRPSTLDRRFPGAAPGTLVLWELRVHRFEGLKGDQARIQDPGSGELREVPVAELSAVPTLPLAELDRRLERSRTVENPDWTEAQRREAIIRQAISGEGSTAARIAMRSADSRTIRAYRAASGGPVQNIGPDDQSSGSSARTQQEFCGDWAPIGSDSSTQPSISSIWCGLASPWRKCIGRSCVDAAKSIGRPRP